MLKNIVIFMISILVLSCGSSNGQSEIITMESTLIAQDNLYGNGEEGIGQQNVVISDEESWKTLLSQMNSVNNVSDNFTETAIDFSKYKVIAVFDELRGNGGTSLDLDIVSNSENIVVSVKSIAPEGMSLTVMEQPFVIVKILDSGLPILFK